VLISNQVNYIDVFDIKVIEMIFYLLKCAMFS